MKNNARMKGPQRNLRRVQKIANKDIADFEFEDEEGRHITVSKFRGSVGYPLKYPRLQRVNAEKGRAQSTSHWSMLLSPADSAVAGR